MKIMFVVSIMLIKKTSSASWKIKCTGTRSWKLYIVTEYLSSGIRYYKNHKFANLRYYKTG